ncbi:MAG: hypothetical protein F6J86_24310 [Symploca sp. SIO1B1]|nr:hypothetical protein [Symploca sp. SIO1C2]NER52658.1 hypothetical protein [Symploca sp. SIO1A3]NER96933.1 hypothetical protein [Symploca sp. SIO1B1]
MNTYTSVARRQEAGGKKESCKGEGNYNCLSELDITVPYANWWAQALRPYIMNIIPM